MRKILLSTAGVAAVMAAVPAFAQADAPFTGGYLGVAIGHDKLHNDRNATFLFDRNLDGSYGDTITTSVGANAFSPGFCGGAARTSLPADGCRKDKNGVSYAVRTGYDHQQGSLVVGWTVEIGKSEIYDAVSAFSTTPANYVIIREIDFLAGVRGRVGFAANKTLFYGAGGVAYAQLDRRNRTNNTANFFNPRGDKDSWGAQFGGGVEHKLGDKFSLGVEYLYNRINDDKYIVRVQRLATTPATNPFILGNAAGTDYRRSDSRFEFSSIRAVANFRF